MFGGRNYESIFGHHKNVGVVWYFTGGHQGTCATNSAHRVKCPTQVPAPPAGQPPPQLFQNLMKHLTLPSPLISSSLSLARIPPPKILWYSKSVDPLPSHVFFSPSKCILGSMIHHCNCSLPCTKSISCLYPPSLYSGQTPILVTLNSLSFCGCTVENAWRGSHTHPKDCSHFKSWPLTSSEPSFHSPNLFTLLFF